MKKKKFYIVAIIVLILVTIGGIYVMNRYIVCKNALEELGEANITYTCGDASELSSYSDKSEKDFQQICKCLEIKGYQVYSASTKNENHFATYVLGDSLMHVYWLKEMQELTIISSDSAGATLPPQKPEVTDGEHDTTVTQLCDADHVNGMGYVIQLADGSFIVYDGAYKSQSEVLYQTLCELNGGEEGIHIAAWLLTHNHGDHSECFQYFTYEYSKQVKLDYVLAAPLKEVTSASWYKKLQMYTEKYQGAKLVTVHTGMEFAFCNLKMEILFAPDDLYKHEMQENFNASSVVSRLLSGDKSFLALADAPKESGEFMLDVYGSYLESDICQVSHHGVEDMPFTLYDVVKASTLFYPCNQWLYDLQDRADDVRKAVREADYTKEILIAGNGQYTCTLEKKE